MSRDDEEQGGFGEGCEKHFPQPFLHKFLFAIVLCSSRRIQHGRAELARNDAVWGRRCGF